MVRGGGPLWIKSTWEPVAGEGVEAYKPVAQLITTTAERTEKCTCMICQNRLR